MSMDSILIIIFYLILCAGVLGFIIGSSILNKEADEALEEKQLDKELQNFIRQREEILSNDEGFE